MAALGLLLSLLLAASWCPAQLRGLQRGHLTVYYEPRDEAFARSALDAATAALPTLETALDMRYQIGTASDERPPISLVIAHSPADFNRLVGAEMKPWVQGVALSGRRIILKPLLPVVMRGVVAHELAHVLLDEIAAREHVEPPRWLHEGLAKYAADDFAPADRDVLGRAVVEGRLLTFAQLEDAFAGKREDVDLAYAQSYTFVRFLHELPGAGSIAQLLRNFALTGDMDRALLRTYGQTPDQLQQQWLTQVKRDYLKHGLPLANEALIWAIMGLLALIAFLIQRARRRLIRERLQEDERLRRIFGQAPDDSDEEPDEFEKEYWE
jgi:hypothetical protein